MTKHPTRRSFLTLLALAPLALGTGCAMLKTPEESLRERAQAFWDARKAGDDITAYRFEELSKRPDSNLQSYLKGRAAIEYRKVEIKSVRLKTPTEAEVILDMSYTIPAIGLNKPIEGEVKDPWVLIDGQWYHAFRPTGHG
ncbi:MAG: twin-arginine translocation signal domain-containing protein [Pseudomonadota bacterium]|jgi:hypothetical protein